MPQGVQVQFLSPVPKHRVKVLFQKLLFRDVAQFGSAPVLGKKLNIMDITQSKGNVVELQCLAAFMKLGYECSIPYGNGAKYDFVVDYNGELLRIQCKSSIHPLRKDGTRDLEAFSFSAVSQTTNTVKTVRHRYSSSDIDYFATFFQGNVYVVPVDECSTSKTLRFSPPLNGNKTYNKAEDYLITNYFNSRFDYDNDNNLIEKKYYCLNCEKNIVSKEGGICHQCLSLKSRKTERPTREELKNLIRTKSFLEIARIYGVSDNAIRKWCDSEKLPRKKSVIKNISDADWKNI